MHRSRYPHARAWITTVTLCAAMFNAAVADDSQPLDPRLEPAYVRTAPDARAAWYAEEAPVLAAAQKARDTDEPVPQIRAEALASWGPWLTATGVSDNARQLLAFLARVDSHGLSATAYGYPTLVRAISRREGAAARQALDAGIARLFQRSATGQPDAAKITDEGERLARRLDESFLRLVTHLGQGVVDARTTQRGLFRDVPTIDAQALLEQLESGALDTGAALRSVMPSHPSYHRLVSALAILLDERDANIMRTVVPEVGSLWVGHHHDDVMAIKHRLQETGDLDINVALTPMFDAPLKLAIEAFQSRHGLPVSGIVDPRTRGVLNTSVDDSIAQVAMNLERWRWMPRELGERHFFMNLPDYRLHMMNGRQRIIDMPVVIGSTNHPTPTFSQDMSYVEVNPTWSVPKSITHRELLPKELARPGYLAQRNFDFLEYRDGRYRKIAYDSVTRADLRRRPFPYLLRQRGGPGNALGRMKFMMPNPYAIYLHDTQSKSHFTLDERAYSHGCIRLGDPEHLLNVVLQVDGHSPARASALLAQQRTRRVLLDSVIPTHITYLTAWVDDSGKLQTRRDVYRHDAALHIALQAAGTLLSEPAVPGEASDAARQHGAWQFTRLGS